MITDFQASQKTAIPRCGFACCGNKFGRIEKSFLHKGKRLYPKHHHGNRLARVRRYAKHVERQLVQVEIKQQLQEEYETMLDAIQEWNEFWADCQPDWN